MEWYLKVLKEHYADFNGRARRQEYWMFVLINFGISVVLSVIEALTGLPPFLSGIYSIAVLVPGIGVSVRRLHDINKSGWMLLLALIPLVGGIILLIWMAKEGDKGSNQYGNDPKGVAGGEVSNNPFE
ncbi:MAG: DUF805 domain-containing protein [Flavobacteriaceae bacterium]|nr:DUF805 domain-containing protein [Flavobacteriaceae bacterium]